MHAQFATRPGHAGRINEDWVGATSSVGVVLDGLSTTPDANDTGCAHGVPWFVAQLGPRLLTSASPSLGTDLEAALSAAIAEVAELHSECDLSHPGTPSAAVAIVRTRAEEIDYLVLADAVVVLRTTDGGIATFSDHRVDEVASAERHAAMNPPIDTATHQRAVTDLVEAQRPLRNKAGGYWVAGSDPSAARHTISGTEAADRTKDVALLSDGASRYVDVFETGSWSTALDLMRDRGPEALVSEVRSQEQDDPRGTRWPRYKKSDDAAALYINWNSPTRG